MGVLSSASHPGVSQPPAKWHTGPGCRLFPGATVWYVSQIKWPVYTVIEARVVTIWGRYDDAVTLSGGRPQQSITVSLARVFVSKQEAEAEARILEQFAGEPSVPAPKFKLEVKRSKRYLNGRNR